MPPPSLSSVVFMNLSVRSPRDFWAGALYAAFGVAGLVLARNYAGGSAAVMGPGYFPTVLSWLLVLIGTAAILRSLIRNGEAVGGIAWKPLLLVLGSTMAFAVLLEPAGLIVALFAVCLVSAVASAHFRLEWRASAALVGLVAFCAIVFVEVLRVPMPLLGTWFGG